jgi:NhaP-type Na+/H+ or K+/H+ antiporter
MALSLAGSAVGLLPVSLGAALVLGAALSPTDPVLAPGIATEFGWSGVMFGLAALLFRRLPALLALKRPLRADWTEVIWLGWFGPIGVAALFYLGHADEQGVTDPSVWTAGTLVITLSTVVHGLTAAPGRLGYRRHLQRTPG